MSETAGLGAMRAERDRLDRQIREAEATATAEFNSRLEELSSAILGHAHGNGIHVDTGQRKNWETVTLAGRVSVQFGERLSNETGGSWGALPGGLKVTAGGMTTEFDPLPSAKTLVGLVDLLLAQDEGER